MLKSALKVVDAARSLGLVEDNGRTKSSLEPYLLATNLEALREAISRFDAETSHSISDLQLVNRPDFAAPPQLDDENADELVINLTPEYQPSAQNVLEDQKLSISPDLGRKDPNKTFDPNAPATLFEPRYVTTAPKAAVPGTGSDYADAEFNVNLDSDASVEDFYGAIARLEQKMAFAMKKTGWNPRLKKLASSMLEMRKRLVLEMNSDEVFVKIPAALYAKLAPAIADAVMDTDMKMQVPALKVASVLDRKRELDVVLKPKV